MRPDSDSHFFRRLSDLLSLNIPETSPAYRLLKEFIIRYNFYYAAPHHSADWPCSPLNEGISYYRDAYFESSFVKVVARLYCRQHGVNPDYFFPCLVTNSETLFKEMCSVPGGRQELVVSNVTDVQEFENTFKQQVKSLFASIICIDDAETDGAAYFSVIQSFFSENPTLQHDVTVVLRRKGILFLCEPPQEYLSQLPWQGLAALHGIYGIIANNGLMLPMHQLIAELANSGDLKTILSEFGIALPPVIDMNLKNSFPTVQALKESLVYQTLQETLKTSTEPFAHWFSEFIDAILEGLEKEKRLSLETQEENIRRLLQQSLSTMEKMMTTIRDFLRAGIVSEFVKYAYLLLEEVKLWGALIGNTNPVESLLSKIKLTENDRLVLTSSGLEAFDHALRMAEAQVASASNFEEKMGDHFSDKPTVLVMNPRSLYYQSHYILKNKSWCVTEARGDREDNPMGGSIDIAVINIYPSFSPVPGNNPASEVRFSNDFLNLLQRRHKTEQQSVDPVQLVNQLIDSKQLHEGSVIIIDNTMSPYEHELRIRGLIPVLEKHKLVLLLTPSLTKLGFFGSDFLYGGYVLVVDPANCFKWFHFSEVKDDLSFQLLGFFAKHCFGSLRQYVDIYSNRVHWIGDKFSDTGVLSEMPREIHFSYLRVSFKERDLIGILVLLAAMGLPLVVRDAYGYPWPSVCLLGNEVRIAPGVIDDQTLYILFLFITALASKKGKFHFADDEKYSLAIEVAKVLNPELTKYYHGTSGEMKGNDNEIVAQYKMDMMKKQAEWDVFFKHPLLAIVCGKDEVVKEFETSESFKSFQMKIVKCFFSESLVMAIFYFSEEDFFKSIFCDPKSEELRVKLISNINSLFDFANKFENNGWSPKNETLLAYAIRLGKCRVAEWLFSLGADPKQMHSQTRHFIGSACCGCAYEYAEAKGYRDLLDLFNGKRLLHLSPLVEQGLFAPTGSAVIETDETSATNPSREYKKASTGLTALK